MAAQNKVFVLSEAAYQQATDFDVVMLYQVLLGRNPENSTVIQNHRLNPFNVTLQGFINSPEFRDSVLNPLGVGAAVRRHDSTTRPSPDQLTWLFSRALLDESQKDALRTAPGWEAFFQHLCGLDGFLEPLASSPPPPRPTAPFKPKARPLPRLRPDTAEETPIPPATPPGPTNTELMARLDLLEAMLAELLQRSAPAQAASEAPRRAPPAAPPPRPARLPAAPARKSPVGKTPAAKATVAKPSAGNKPAGKSPAPAKAAAPKKPAPNKPAPKKPSPKKPSPKKPSNKRQAR